MIGTLEILSLGAPLLGLLFSLFSLHKNKERKKEIINFINKQKTVKMQLKEALNKDKDYRSIDESLETLIHLLEKEKNLDKYLDKNFRNNNLKNEQYLKDIILNNNIYDME